MTDDLQLRRMEAKIDLLLRHVETVDYDLRERMTRLEDDAARAYRRGYSCGYATANAGRPDDPDLAVQRRRTA